MVDNREAARWRRIVDVLRAEADRLVDARARARKQVEIGDTLYDRLGDARGAADAWVAAVEADPHQPGDALRRLERLARSTKDGRLYQRWVSGLKRAGRWSEVIALMDRRSEALRDPRKRCRLRLEAARVCAEKMGDRAGARRFLVAAAEDAGPDELDRVWRLMAAHLSEAPEDEEAGAALARLLARCDLPEEAVEQLVATSAHVRDFERKAALVYEAAFLCERAGRPARAPDLLHDALVFDPRRQAEVMARLDALGELGLSRDDGPLVEALVSALDRLDLSAKAQDLLARRVRTVDGAQQVARRLRQAQHAEEQLGDAEKAFALYRAVAAVAADPTPAFDGLARTGLGRPDAFEVVSELCTRRERWAELARLCVDTAAFEVDDDQRAALLYRAGTLYEEKLDDAEQAMARYVEAFKLRPRDARYLEAGERLYRRKGEWPMVDRLIGLRLRIAGQGDDRRALLIERARLRWEQMADPLRAYDALREALAATGDATVEDGAFGMLEALVADGAAFPAIRVGLQQRAEEDDPAAGGRRLLELAGLHLNLRGELDEGLEALRAAIDRAPADPDLFRRVAETVARHAGPDAEAAWLRAAEGRPLPPFDRREALARAGTLYGERGALEAAFGAWAAVLDIDPVDAEALDRLAALAEEAEETEEPERAEAAAGADLTAQLIGRIETALDGAARGSNPAHQARWLRALARGHRRRAEAGAELAAWERLFDLAPDDADALAAVEGALRERGDLATLADRYAAAVRALELSGDLAVRHRRVLVELHGDALDDPTGAAGWARPLVDVPDVAAEMAPRLFALYRAAGDRQRGIDLARRLLTRAEDDAARQDAATRLVSLAEQPPADERALTMGLLALSDLRPDDPRPALQLADLARRTGDDEALLVALGRLAAQTPGPTGLPIRREAARVMGEQRGETGPAIAAWQAVLADAPDDGEALAGLQRLHARDGDDEQVHALLWRRQQLTGDPEDRIALLREAAITAELRLGDADAARRAFETILELRPEDGDALDELIRLAEDAGDRITMARAAEQRLPGLDGPDRADLARRMAEVCAEEPADDAAAVAWWRLALEADPEEPDALQALARDAETRDAVDEALALWGRLAALGRPTRLVRRALVRRAELSDGGEIGAAMEAWWALARFDEQDTEPLVRLRAVALAAGEFRAAADALLHQIHRAPDRDRPELERTLARIFDGPLGVPDEAIATWERVAALVPGDDEALGRLVALYARTGRGPDLWRVVDQMARAGHAGVGAALVRGAAEAEEAGWSDLAFDCWSRAHHGVDGDDSATLDALDRLATTPARASRYAEALALSAGRTSDPAERSMLLLDAADVWDERAQQPARAFAQMQAVFDLDPGSAEPLERLIDLADRLDDDRTWAALSDAWARAAEVRRDRARCLAEAADVQRERRRRDDLAFELLSRAFAGEDCTGLIGARVEADLIALARRGARWDALVTLFDNRARVVGVPKTQAALLHRLGAALERHGGRPEAAFEQYLMAFQLRPVDDEIRASVHRLAGQLDEWSVVERVLRLALDRSDAPADQVPVLRALAELQLGPLLDPEEAFDTLKKAFILDPEDGETRRALASMAHDRRVEAELAAYYAEEAGWASDQAHRIALYRAAIDTYKAVGDQITAAALLKKLRRLAPELADLDGEGLELLRQASDPAPLARALEQQVERTEGRERLDLLRELAGVYAERMAAPEQAEGAWRRTLDIRPHDEPAFAALIDSLTARQAWAELDAALAEGIERTTAVARRNLMRQRAEVLHFRRGRPVEAFELLAEVARAEPTDLELLDTLAGRAARAEAWSNLVACAERSVAFAPRARVADVLLLIGRTARDRLGDPKKALSALGRALELRPDTLELAREVAALMKLRRQHGPLVKLMKLHGPPLVAEAGEAVDAPEVRARWALGRAELLADRLYRVDEAIAVMRTLVEEQSTHLDALRRLRALCARANDGAGLRDAVERLAGLTMGVDRLKTLVDGARDLTGMGEVGHAVAIWRMVLAEAPGHPEAQQAVARQAARQEDWALMVEQLEARVRAAHGADERAERLCELGALHRERTEDLDAAATAYDRARKAAPDHVEALAGRVELAVEAGAPLDRHAEALEARLDLPTSDAEWARIAPLLADVQLTRAAAAAGAGHEEQTLRILQGARARLPNDARIGQALADTLYEVGELHAVAELYRVLPMPAVDDDGEVKAKEHVRRGRALRAVGADDEAMRHFEMACNHPATRACAVEQLANLQERAGRWEAAARLREKLADAVDDPQARRAAWVAAGLILEHRVGSPVRAMQAYDKAVDGGLGEPVLLANILRLYRAQQRPDRVLQVAEKLLAGDAGGRRRAELWCDRGWALNHRGDLTGAREAWRTALREHAGSAEAAEHVLTDLAAADAAEQLETLELARQALDQVTGAARAPLVEALLGWTLEHGQDDEAELLASELVELRPAHHGARVSLSRLLVRQAEATDDPAEETARLQRALVHRRAAVRLRPADVADLRALADLCERAGHPRWAALPRSLLALTGMGRAAETLHADDAPPLSAGLRKGHLADPAWRRPVGLLLNALHTWIARPLDAMLREVRAEHGLPAAEVDAGLAAEAVEVATALGLSFDELRIDPDADAPLDLAGLAPPVPIIGAPILAERDPVARRFALARAFELTRGCAVHAAYVPQQEARALFAGAVALARPGDGPDFALGVDAPPDRVAWWAEMLHGVLDGRRLDALAQFAAPVASGSPAAFAEWTDGMHRTADRVALWIAGDLGAGLSWLRTLDPELAEHRLQSPRELRAALEASEAMSALHDAAFGDDLFALLEATAATPDGGSLDALFGDLEADAPSLDDVARSGISVNLMGPPEGEARVERATAIDFATPYAAPTAGVPAPLADDEPDGTADANAADANAADETTAAGRPTALDITAPALDDDPADAADRALVTPDPQRSTIVDLEVPDLSGLQAGPTSPGVMMGQDVDAPAAASTVGVDEPDGAAIAEEDITGKAPAIDVLEGLAGDAGLLAGEEIADEDATGEVPPLDEAGDDVAGAVDGAEDQTGEHPPLDGLVADDGPPSADLPDEDQTGEHPPLDDIAAVDGPPGADLPDEDQTGEHLPLDDIAAVDGPPGADLPDEDQTGEHPPLDVTDGAEDGSSDSTESVAADRTGEHPALVEPDAVLDAGPAIDAPDPADGVEMDPAPVLDEDPTSSLVLTDVTPDAPPSGFDDAVVATDAASAIPAPFANDELDEAPAGHVGPVATARAPDDTTGADPAPVIGAIDPLLVLEGAGDTLDGVPLDEDGDAFDAPDFVDDADTPAPGDAAAQPAAPHTLAAALDFALDPDAELPREASDRPMAIPVGPAPGPSADDAIPTSPGVDLGRAEPIAEAMVTAVTRIDDPAPASATPATAIPWPDDDPADDTAYDPFAAAPVGELDTTLADPSPTGRPDDPPDGEEP